MKKKHNCPSLKEVVQTSAVCPICNTSLPIPPGGDANNTVFEHIERNCRKSKEEEERLKAKKNNKCSYPHCKQYEIDPIFCKLCNRKYCISHRLEIDHHCPKSNFALPSNSQNNNQNRNNNNSNRSNPQNNKQNNNQNNNQNNRRDVNNNRNNPNSNYNRNPNNNNNNNNTAPNGETCQLM